MDKLVNSEALKKFIKEIYIRVGTRSEEAELEADLLVMANLRGIESHGVGSLPFRLSYIEEGLINLAAEVHCVNETMATVFLDADNGFGVVVGRYAMDICIKKARDHGIGIASVRNSSHFGIAAYYARLALEKDMIGIALTNSTALTVPTNGVDPLLGTNPICLAAPSGLEYPFLLDMATSVVSAGKVSLSGHLGHSIPLGWAINQQGIGMTDPSIVSQMLYSFSGGGLVPLGGIGEEHGGHKGYGLALMVDVLTGLLSGSAYGPFPYRNKDGQKGPGNIGHFFAAISIEAFRPLSEFKIDIDNYIHILKNSTKFPGQDRIYIHGEKEFENEKHRRETGIPLSPKTINDLKMIADKYMIRFTL